jgi:hypothetical protein
MSLIFLILSFWYCYDDTLAKITGYAPLGHVPWYLGAIPAVVVGLVLAVQVLAFVALTRDAR